MTIEMTERWLDKGRAVHMKMMIESWWNDATNMRPSQIDWVKLGLCFE